MPQHPALSKDCIAVITGGASGIGLAAAKRFAAIGMKLVLADLRQDALDRAAAQLSGAELVTVPTDVSKIDLRDSRTVMSNYNVPGEVQQRMGRLHQ
jgi:NADP-dependent 3-hydroxy acid dehydrogenase YdfG